MKTKGLVFTLLTLFVCITASAETWTDANGTEWYFTTDGENATISIRGWDNVNSCIIPSISGVIPTDLTIPSIVYIGETPYTVTSIGYKAFANCSSITTITIPNGVISIVSYAFENCSFLTTITIPESVTSIGFLAFSGCSSLATITIPEGVTSFESGVFSGCSSLTSITIPNSVTTIGSYAFSGCFNLATINMGNGIRDIGVGAFNETAWYNNQEDGIVYIGNIAYKYKGTMSENASIEVKDGTLSIGVSAFSSCENLHSIILPNSLKIIGNAAFSQCPNLTSINIPNGLTTIGDGAFEGCSSLASITIPEGVTSIGGSAFFECSSLTSITIPEGVTCIRTETFNGCSSLKSITIPESVTSILDFSFWDCSSLTSITIPEGVTSIGPAFDGCRSLKSIIVGMKSPAIQIATIAFSEHYETATLYVPAGSKAAYQVADVWKDFKNIIEYNYVVGSNNPPVEHPENLWTDANGTEWYFTTDGSNATITNRGCNNDYIPSISGTIPSELTIPSTVYVGETPYSVTAIGDDAFLDCSALTSIIIPNSVISIGDYAFYRCSGLASVTIPNSVTSISSSAFEDCSGLTSIVVEDENNTYDSRENCNAIIETDENTLILGCKDSFIPNNVTSIGRGAFAGCSGLTSITIPNSVTSIDYAAFYGCSGLTSVTIPNNVTSIDDFVFSFCYALTFVTIPNGVTSIGEGAFRYCSFTSITIPNSVTSIGYAAFYSCSGLTSVTIPNSVTTIGDYAFDECSDLTSVIVDWATPISIDSNVFSNIANITLYVPYGSKAAYEAADCWKNFKEIVEIDTDISQLDNAIYIEPFVAKVGENTQMEICLKNAEAATAYVFDLVLPEGITVATNDKGKYIDELSDRHDDHTRTINYKGENTYSFSTLSGNSEELTGNDGPIRFVTLHVDDAMEEGVYPILIKNASYSKPNGNLVALAATKSSVTIEDYVLGDVNGNGGVDIGDAVSIVNYLVGKDSSIFVAKAADTNKNGQIDIGDAVTIVNLLVGKITNFTREFNIIWDEKEPE